MELEDGHGDILKKAMVGQLMPVKALAEKAELSPETVRALLDGAIDLDALRKAAPILNLSSDALCAIAEDSYQPETSAIEGLIPVVTPFRGWSVNAFILHDSQGRAAVFDTGTDPAPIIREVRSRKLQVKSIFITHSHPDHIMGLSALCEEWEPAVYAVDTEQVAGAQAIEYGETYAVGDLNFKTLETTGHAADGVSFFVEDLEKPVVVVGDALFAGSMGGGMSSYRQAIETTGANLMTLPAETIVCPGHGPLTTIGQEQQHNAFFEKR